MPSSTYKAGNNHYCSGSLLTTMAEVAPKELKWFWHPYIPYGKLTLVYGDNEDSVRGFLLSIASAASRGEIGKKEDGTSSTILYQDLEMEPGFIKGELLRYNADVTKIGFLTSQEFNLLQVGELINETDFTILIVFPVEDFLWTKKSMKAMEIEKQLKRLAYFANETGCALIIGSDRLHRDKDTISRNLAEPIRRIPRSILEVTQKGFRIHQEKNNLTACSETELPLPAVKSAVEETNEKDTRGTAIEQLKLEARINHVLKRAGKMTIEDVLSIEDRKALLQIRNLGAVSVEKILNALSEQGYDISKFQ